VIGAQIVISTIQHGADAPFFLIWNDYPYVTVIIVLTFLCGLLPIIGNILSNTLIVGVGFRDLSPMALIALIFLVLIHKLEYFLNSKIVGDRIKNPMWLTLIGLVLGEKLMGIPGMILAPVVLALHQGGSVAQQGDRNRAGGDRCAGRTARKADAPNGKALIVQRPDIHQEARSDALRHHQHQTGQGVALRGAGDCGLHALR
jgi:hypothetical protein